MMKKATIVAAVLLALVLAPAAVRSQDALADKAEAAWAARGDLAQALLAVELFEQLASRAPGDTSVRIKLAQAAYWAVELDEAISNTTGADRMDKDRQAALTEIGITACREVLARDQAHVGANYWLMYNMAARTLAKGIFSGFAFRDSVVGTIMVSKADVDYHYGGVYRYWGAVIVQIPDLLGKFFHFTKDDSVFMYQQAIAAEPRYLRTHVWLAECYQEMDRNDLAKAEYEFCVAQDPDALPDAAIENAVYKKLAEKRLAEM
jgi:tetratricopeptide (TPR) repeat protein